MGAEKVASTNRSTTHHSCLAAACKQAGITFSAAMGTRCCCCCFARLHLHPQAICHGLEAHTKRAPAPKVAVDAVFARRLLAILKM